MSHDMTPEEFRAHGHAVVDWIADYRAELETLPVLSRVSPGEVAAALPAGPPEAGEPFGEILADLDRVVVPGLTHWQHPSFFGYFPANASGASVLGDLVSSGLGVQGMLWATSPACTEVETVVVDWLAQLLGLPDTLRGPGGGPEGGTAPGAGGGCLQDSASSATLVALLAALHRAGDGRVGRVGVDRRHSVYASGEAHSSVEKAVRIAGLGADNLRPVPVDPGTLAMRPDALREAIAADRAAGALPTMAIATIGTTSTTAIDPVAEIGAVCRDEGVWLHVDAAYAGAAAACPELRWTHAGLELADSYCTDPHKWLLTNFDCDALWVADRAALTGALSILPEYLRNAATEGGAVVDYRDWQVPLGRRFRALKLWFVLRWYGAEGIRAGLREHVALAAAFADRVRADPRFAVVAPHPFSLVCFRLTDDACGGRAAADAANAALLDGLNASGALFLTHTRVDGAYTLRMAIGAVTTEARHVEAAWDRIAGAAEPAVAAGRGAAPADPATAAAGRGAA